MPWTNYHSHTHFCDGASEPEEYIKEAIQQGLPAYGYSAHAPVNFPTEWCVPDNKLHDYLSAIQKIKQQYSGQIEIYLGLEIDYIPGIAGRSYHLNKDCSLDFFIGSVHFVDAYPNGTPWGIDFKPEGFQDGLVKIFNNDIRKAVTRFYTITREMIVNDKPDVIGHLDKIKMFNKENIYFKENEKWYREQVELTLQEIKKAGSIVEINTRGYYRYGQPDLYPSEWICEKILKMDIPIMINSDAHHPSEIVAGYEYTAQVLKKIGFEKVSVLLNGSWQDCKFNEKGLVL